jgi:probable FeS assembly SUF system protein SufT
MDTQLVTLSRSCDVMEIPSGIPYTLQDGALVRIIQTLGGSYTVSATDSGRMFRIDAKNADALGFDVVAAEAAAAPQGELDDKMVWGQLKTIYDPEIPVNIADLGLVYGCEIKPHEQGGKLLDVKMTMTAPGCGMGNVLKADVERRLGQLPGVTEVRVEIVFEPQWHPGLMSEAAKLQLGFDMDYGSSSSSLPVVRDAK